MKNNCFMCFSIIILFCVTQSFAQLTVPYTFENSSRYNDDEIYVGLVGKTNELGDVWMDMTDSEIQIMSANDNTIPGPDFSYPTEWLYPDIFTKLSDINNKTIQIPHGLYACRIFISFESPMYLHFHETGGYAGANLNNPGDPNDGIRWEIVELTWGDAGLWTNTSRVDAYQYPMGLEVNGFSGGVTGTTYETSYNQAVNGSGSPQFKKIGEVLSHQEILDAWDNTVSNAYKVAKVIKDNSIDGEPIIEQPSKVTEFTDDILDDYIDDIWNTYKNNDLSINIGDRGTWLGRVQSNDTFLFTDPADGSIATIHGKPTTINAMEGSGFLAYTPYSAADNLEKYNEDLMIQAQMAAAITRHAIYTNITNGTTQYTHDADRFFVIEPYNEYVKFFHDESISYESQTYAFAYDDVGDHSSTIQTTFPTEVKVIIGGYGETTTTTPTTFNPDPNKTYYIDVPIHNLRLAANGESEDAYTTSTNTTGNDVEWKFVAKGNGSWHIQRAAGGSVPRLRTDNSENADMNATTSSGTYTYYDFEQGSNNGTYFITLPDGPTNYKRLQVNNSGQVKMVSTASNGTWESFTFTEVTGNTTSTSIFIEAEDYTTMSGVGTEETSDDDTLNVGWIDSGDWMEYTINISTAGTYTIYSRISSPNSGANTVYSVNNTTVGSANIPYTGGWQSWETISTTVNLSAGTQTLRIASNGSGFNINWIEINGENTTNPGVTNTPIFIEAEDYTAMSGVQTEETSDDDTLNVGWIDNGDWMEYTVNISAAGTYTIYSRISSPHSGSSAQYQINGSSVATFDIPDTDGWQNWETISTTVNLSAGTQTLRLTSTGNGFNINWIEISSENNSAKDVAENNLINSKSSLNTITLYPVPVQSELNISLKGYENITSAQIIDLSGHIILESNNINQNTIYFNTNNLSKGLYIARILSNNDTVAVKKFTK